MSLFAGTLVALTGCTLFKEPPPAEPSSLPPIKTLTDSVGLEIVFLNLPANSDTRLAPMWTEIDETHLPTDLRRRLAANGIRCGLFGSQMPVPLKQLVDELVEPAAGPESQGVRVGAKRVHTCRQLQSLTGQPSELLATDICPEMTLLMLSERGEVAGRTYRDAQGKWVLKTFPQGDGRVRLQLTPEIHHGQQHNTWVGQSTGIFRQVSGQQRDSFDNLRIETLLTPGQTLVLCGTEPLVGLGRHFFGFGDPSGPVGKKLLLIRLARTQYDDLFSAERVLAPTMNHTGG
jgi:hypothetical protein